MRMQLSLSLNPIPTISKHVLFLPLVVKHNLMQCSINVSVGTVIALRPLELWTIEKVGLGSSAAIVLIAFSPMSTPQPPSISQS